MDIIIVAPSLDSHISLGGISAVASFIVKNNTQCNYIHFEQGKRDAAKGGVYRVPALIKHLRKWKALLKEHPQAIIHYNFPLTPASILRDFFFMKAAKKMNRKMVIHLHGGLYMNAEKIPFIFNYILTDIFSWKNPLIVLSMREKERIEKQFNASNIAVLPNCVELPRFNKEINEDKELTIGYIGRITPEKGMSELLDACGLLKKQGTHFKVLIAGAEEKNDYINPFKETLGEDFHYAGIVSGEKKEDFFRKLDVFILPSYFEGLPISLLECMSYGIAPVVTPVGSIPELVDDNVNGLIIKTHDVDTIVNAIRKLDVDRKLLSRLGMNAQQFIYNHYRPESYFLKLNELYNQLSII